MTQSSGIPSLDRTAERAINASDPFPPFPRTIEGQASASVFISSILDEDLLKASNESKRLSILFSYAAASVLDAAVLAQVNIGTSTKASSASK